MSGESSVNETEPGLGDVVVGLDGSQASLAALRWTAAQLAPEGRIHALHVATPDDDTALDGEVPAAWIPAALGGRPHPDLVVAIREGDVADELLGLAAELNAEAVIVGHHAQARLGAQIVGHVTANLLQGADCPVVVVPVDWEPELTDDRPVAVGVGLSEDTHTALRWALEHTRYHRSGLILVHTGAARGLFRSEGWLDVLAYYLDPTVLSEWGEQDFLDLAEELRAETGADVDVAPRAELGRTGRQLVEAGSSAALLVVGRGEPPFIGSRTIAPYLRHAIVHAPCPIVVVPAPDRRP